MLTALGAGEGERLFSENSYYRCRSPFRLGGAPRPGEASGRGVAGERNRKRRPVWHYCRNTWRHCELIHAGYWNGSVPVPVNYGLAPPEIRYILEDAQTSRLFIEGAFLVC